MPLVSLTLHPPLFLFFVCCSDILYLSLRLFVFPFSGWVKRTTLHPRLFVCTCARVWACCMCALSKLCKLCGECAAASWQVSLLCSFSCAFFLSFFVLLLLSHHGLKATTTATNNSRCADVCVRAYVYSHKCASVLNSSLLVCLETPYVYLSSFSLVLFLYLLFSLSLSFSWRPCVSSTASLLFFPPLSFFLLPCTYDGSPNSCPLRTR